MHIAARFAQCGLDSLRQAFGTQRLSAVDVRASRAEAEPGANQLAAPPAWRPTSSAPAASPGMKPLELRSRQQPVFAFVVANVGHVSRLSVAAISTRGTFWLTIRLRACVSATATPTRPCVTIADFGAKVAPSSRWIIWES